jgi:tellurite resistance protein TerC
MEVTFLGWVGLIVGLVILLVLDLFVFHRGAHEVPIRNAAWSTAGFVAIALGFGVVLGLREGSGVAGQFFAGYALEFSLSLDNVFVWALIFGAFAIPAAYQHRVLFYGIFAALVLRGAFVAAGSELLNAFHWIVYAFGALLLLGGVRMIRGTPPPDPKRSPAVRLLRRYVPTTNHLVGAHLFVRGSHLAPELKPARKPLPGGWLATPMLAVLGVVELTDIVFAADSIPAIFGVTREPFIVFSATALALVGLRSLYFLLAGARDRFAYLDIGLGVILIFLGVKFIMSNVVHIGVGISLLVIFGVVTIAIAASLREGSGERRRRRRVWRI